MLTAAASPAVKSLARKRSSSLASSVVSPPVDKKIRAFNAPKVQALNAPTMVSVVDLSDVQFVSVDDDVVCVECQKPMVTEKHYKSVAASTFFCFVLSQYLSAGLTTLTVSIATLVYEVAESTRCVQYRKAWRSAGVIVIDN